ncbi:MAG: hypothetical protein GXO60_07660 [Epsilonproteobacteria bacterium]|nr:hypothetical protein [Campylobacterota bacterium]
MKAIKYITIIGGLVAIIVATVLSLSSKQHMITIVKGNNKKKPIDIELHKYQDSQCGMVIDGIEYASEVISPDGRTWFFHDHGGMVKWLERQPFKKDATVWVRSRDTNRWIDAKKAHYTRDEETPMHYGFGAYEKAKQNTITFEQMRLLTLRGETMENPIIRKQLLKTKKEQDGYN